MNNFEPIERCPNCDSEDLIEDDGLHCTECGWSDENPDYDEEEEEE